MTRWLVLGGSGMLGACVVNELRGDVSAPPHVDLDLCDVRAIRQAVLGSDIVVNCAGWTDVDGAERNPEAPMAVEGGGVQGLAEACDWNGVPLLHVSTDYVFDGTAREPYAEDAAPNPVSAYGRAKAAGERHVLATARGYVVRTAWLYARHGRNFVNTILSLASQRETLQVVDDQRGQPTSAHDVAVRLVELGQLALADKAPPGIYHATSSGSATWFEFAQGVFVRSGLDPERIRPTTGDTLGRPARRPAYSVLGHEGWARVGLPPMRSWTEALDEHMAAVVVA